MTIKKCMLSVFNIYEIVIYFYNKKAQFNIITFIMSFI